MQTILVVDDDPTIRSLLVEYLTKHSFNAAAAVDSTQLNKFLASQPVDLVILDLNLGDEDGLEIVRQLNEKPDLPIIIISGDRLDETDKVLGLELGASDYITKPFGMREFLARVRVALRERPTATTNTSNNVYLFDGWRVNTRHRKLRDASGQEVKLTASEFNLLMAFLKSPREPLSRERLLIASRVYDQEIFDRSLDVLILRLRRKIELDSTKPRYIKTERGLGYIFDVPVSIEGQRSPHVARTNQSSSNSSLSY